MHRAMVVMAAGLLLVACGSDDEAASTTAPDSTAVETTATDPPDTTDAATTTAAPTTTAEPAPDTTEAAATTTAEPTTTAAPTTTEPAPTTTAAPVLNGLDPACAEVSADGTAGRTEEIGDTFGPLSVEPALSLELPAARSEADPTVQSPAADGVPVEAGLLLGVSAAYGEFDGSQLSLTGWDGETRWVRCVEDNIRFWLAAPSAETVLVDLAAPDTFVSSWYEVDVATGEMTPTSLPIGADTSLYAWNQRVAVFGPFTAGDIDTATQSLLMVDLEDLTVADEMPFPDGFTATGLDSGMFELTDDDELVLLTRDSGLPTAVAVRRDGAWSSDPATLAAAHGIQPAYSFNDAGPAVVGADATGSIVWESTVTLISSEGFAFGRSGDVVVVAGCWEPLAEGEEFCSRSDVGGLDAATGAELWRLENPRAVDILGDGYALVTDGGGDGHMVMIHTNTGEPVPGQAWDEPGLFFTGCCDDQFNTASRFGGTVVTVHDRAVKVFLPEG